MYQVKTLKQSTLMKDIEASDTEYENMLNKGWVCVNITHREGTRENIRYAERELIFIRNTQYQGGAE